MNGKYDMKKMIVACSLLLAFGTVQAQPYGHFDMRQVLMPHAEGDTSYQLNLEYLDRVLDDLAGHARNYPPAFDSQGDKRQALNDAKKLSDMLEIVAGGGQADTELLMRAGFLNSMAYNLDVPKSGERAQAAFAAVLQREPDNANAHYLYGSFLAGMGHAKEALPHLDRAVELGQQEALYSLGMAYLTLGDKDAALRELEAYQAGHPNDRSVGGLIEAVRSGAGSVQR